MLSKISERTGITRKELIEEIERRRNMLHWMREKNIRSYKEVAAMIAEYYTRPKEAFGQVLTCEEVKPIAFSGKP
jgi:flagellar protein FlaI